MTLAAMNRIILHSPPPTPSLPAAFLLATQVATGEGPPYTHGGEHDPGRTLLLRDFVQGLVEIAAVRLKTEHIVPVPPALPLVQSLLDLIKSAILEMQPASESTKSVGLGADGAADGVAGVHLPARVDARVGLAYAHYATVEVQPRSRKTPREPTITVRGFVRMLTDSGLLTSGFNLPALLSSTLPEYLTPPPPVEAVEAPAEAEVVAIEAEGHADADADGEAPAEAPAADEPETKEAAEDGEAAAEPAPSPEELKAAAAAAAVAEAAMMERLEATLGIELIYPEFQTALVSFAAALGPEAPWAPPAEPAEPAEGEGEGEVSPPNAKEAAADEGAEEAAADEADGGADAEGDAVGEASPPPDPVAMLEQTVLPAIGQYLLRRLEHQASAADGP